MDYKYAIGDKVVLVNDFGVVWGVKKIIGLDERTNQPTYYYEGSDTPWYSVPEENLRPATDEDFMMTRDELQAKYGFKPTEYYGCY